MKIYIKNMVCNRCRMMVKAEFELLGLHPLSIELGEVELENALSDSDKEKLSLKLVELGFELIDDKKSRVIEKVKNIIVNLVHHSSEKPRTNLSQVIIEQIPLEYNYISNLFSEVEETSIEQYYIAQKIERVKELLVYDELSLSEIAYQLEYSSVSHLSKQFKKVTGLTTSHFKQLKTLKRLPIENL